MESYQERVIAEKVNLDEKIAKLNSFLDEKLLLPEGEQERLIAQKDIMDVYSAILERRINAFSGTLT